MTGTERRNCPKGSSTGNRRRRPTPPADVAVALRTAGRRLAGVSGIVRLSNWVKSGVARAVIIAAAGVIALGAVVVQSGTAEAKRRQATSIPATKQVSLKRGKQGRVAVARRARTAPADDSSANP